MIYLHRYTTDPPAVDIAICETEASAQAHEARGFIRCSRQECIEAWQDRDALQIAGRPAPRPIVETAPLARAVGGAAEAGAGVSE